MTIYKHRHGTTAQWASPTQGVLKLGEIGFNIDTGETKMGDGVTAFAALPVWGAPVVAAGATQLLARAAIGAAAAITSVAVISASTAPTMEQINRYDATVAALTPPLPALSGLNVGARVIVEKSDSTGNAVTFTTTGADTFTGGGTTLTLWDRGDQRELEVVSISGTKYYKRLGSFRPPMVSLDDGPFTGVATHLRHDRCAIIQGFGDSTMSGPGRAFDLMAADMGAFFDANVWYMPFDDTNKTYFNPTVFHTSSRGIRGVGGANGKIAGTYQGTLPVGDITIDMMITMPSWTSSAGGEFLTKWDEAAAGAGHSDQMGMHFGIGTTGLLYFGWSINGSTNLGAKVSTAAVPFAAGSTGWVKVVFQANDGAGNTTVKFYTSSSGFSYTQLGSTVTTAGTVTSVYQSTTPYQLLSRNKEFATGHAPTGTYVHFLRVRDSAGNDYVPVLPDKWDPNTTATLEPVYNSGAPILLAASGAISGWSLTHLTDPVRYSQLTSLKSNDLIIIEDGHNENSLTQRQFLDQYIAYVRRLKRTKPFVPIVVTTQNPYDKAGTNWTSNPAPADFNPTKMAVLARAMTAEPGVWPIDTFQAFWNPAAGTQLNADGRHPSASGYQAKADFVRKFLLPKAFV